MEESQSMKICVADGDKKVHPHPPPTAAHIKFGVPDHVSLHVQEDAQSPSESRAVCYGLMVLHLGVVTTIALVSALTAVPYILIACVITVVVLGLVWSRLGFRKSDVDVWWTWDERIDVLRRHQSRRQGCCVTSQFTSLFVSGIDHVVVDKRVTLKEIQPTREWGSGSSRTIRPATPQDVPQMVHTTIQAFVHFNYPAASKSAETVQWIPEKTRCGLGCPISTKRCVKRDHAYASCWRSPEQNVSWDYVAYVSSALAAQGISTSAVATLICGYLAFERADTLAAGTLSLLPQESSSRIRTRLAPDSPRMFTRTYHHSELPPCMLQWLPASILVHHHFEHTHLHMRRNLQGHLIDSWRREVFKTCSVPRCTFMSA